MYAYLGSINYGYRILAIKSSTSSTHFRLASLVRPLNSLIRDGRRIGAVRRRAGASKGLLSRVDRQECKLFKILNFLFAPFI